MPSTSKVSSSSKMKNLSKPAAIPTIKKHIKSAERVTDSDDEDEQRHETIPPKPVNNATALKLKPTPSKTKPKALPVSVKSIPAIPNGKASNKPERDDRSSPPITFSSESQSEDEESGGEEEKAKKVGINEKSSEGSSSGSDSGTESTSGDEERKNYKDVSQSKETAPTTYSTPLNVEGRRLNFSRAPEQATSQKPAPQYVLPPGFGPATIIIPSSSKLTDLFSSNSLRTNQFWHVIVPSSVPIYSLREVSTQSVESGSAVFTHEGADYGLVSEVQDQCAKKIILLPSAEANEYKSAVVGISKTFNLQQLVPDRRHGSSAFKADSTNVTNKYEKPVCQQPKGLKMRYRPFGDTEDSSEQSGFESSSEQSMRAPQFRKPISIETLSSSKKNTNHEERDVEMRGDRGSATKKRDRKRHAHSLAPVEPFSAELQKDYIASPTVSKKRKSSPESERIGTERPVKKNRRKAPPESVPDARILPFNLNAVHPKASEASRGSEMEKENVNAERNGMENPSKRQKQKSHSELVVLAEKRLPDGNSDDMRTTIKKKLSAEPVSASEYPEDTIMLDPPLSAPLKSKNEETSHHGNHPNAELDNISVSKDTNQEHGIIPEPMKAKRKSKGEKRRREHPVGKENVPAGDASRSTEAAKEAKTSKPAAELQTDMPTTIKPENTATAEEPKSRQKEKERRQHKRAKASNSNVPPEPLAAKNHPLGTTEAKTTTTTATPPAATIKKSKPPTVPTPSAAAQVEATSAPEHPNVVAARERKHKRRKAMKKERKKSGVST